MSTNNNDRNVSNNNSDDNGSNHDGNDLPYHCVEPDLIVLVLQQREQSAEQLIQLVRRRLRSFAEALHRIAELIAA